MAWSNPAGIDTHPYRRLLTVQSSYIDSTLTNFPVYLNDNNFDSHFFSNVTGTAASNDIQFTASDGTTVLSRYVARLNTGTSELEAYVRIPSVSSSSNTQIYVYYGDGTGRSNDASTFSEHRCVSLDGLTDVTTFDTELTNNGTTAVTGGRSFDGTNDYIQVTDDALHFGPVDRSFEIWFDSDVYTNYTEPGAFYTDRVAGDLGSVQSFTLRVRHQDGYLQMLADNGVGQWKDYRSQSDMTGALHHLVITRDASTDAFLFYIDGSLATMTKTTDGDLTNDSLKGSANMRLGAYTTNERYYKGEIYDFRYYSVVLGADWIAATYDNVNTPASFLTTGGVLTQGGAATFHELFFYM